MEKLKILFITYTHSNGGGAEKVLTTLVNNLDAERYDISIFEIVKYDVKCESVNSNIKLLPSLYHCNDRDYKVKVLDYILEQKPEIIRAMNNSDVYDVIITWNYQLPSFMLPAFPDKKTIAWFHGAIDDLDISDNLTAVKHRYDLQKNAWGFADKVVTISRKSLQSLETVFPEYMHKAQIIHNAFDVKISKIKASEKIEDIYENCYLPIIVCAGRLDKNKNFSLLVKTVAKLKRENIECVLFIIGEGPERESLVRLAAESDITDSVFFLGYKQNPLPYIGRAQLLCVSSLAEGFPTVVLESMALGKPFVTTPVAGASEELADGGKCGLVAEWDIDDYAEKLKILLTDKTLYDRMSENCIKKIQEFSVENTVRQFDNLIASLPEKPDTGSAGILSKKEAFKKMRSVYVWYPDKMLNNIKFSVERFQTTKKIYHFILLGYHILRFLLYILTATCRIVTAKKLFICAKDGSDECI
ncbi:glycosyltransferase [Treponema denticola]|uniref:Glycosyltransferase n=1 Tax=Treponema denticola TaxID=158 RepID=A0A9Q9EWP9_TREDN|nr:glycosyltransferase [Treponema denticola]UTC90765.1 glycosyltransferase [Treponema denticola]UTC99883.1 glycosyltransferase [Treponema denticola]UTD04667.1 glycosyltransferase [Treponema denticola]